MIEPCRPCCSKPDIVLDYDKIGCGHLASRDWSVQATTWRCRGCGRTKAVEGRWKRGPETMLV